jgi:signal transduction histidine kinase
VLSDFFTVNLCIYSAYIFITSSAFSPPQNCVVSGGALFAFVFFLYVPPFGLVADGLSLSVPSTAHALVMIVFLAALGALGALVRFLSEQYIAGIVTIAHLSEAGTKMLLFNHRLQEYVRNSQDEAVKKDRLRFTRDLHDSSGYVFTNIIAITGAAISYPAEESGKTKDALLLIQSQAKEGLQRTRETLHLIRELEGPSEGSIQLIYQMKSIFEEVMGIRVDIESGNMRHDYGKTVNMVLVRIVQEAFTNSVRHGQATRILIHFWERNATLTMTVSDNGIGATHIVKGIGLAGMEERLERVGGTLKVSVPPEGGFRLLVVIPLDESAINMPVSLETAKKEDI